MASLVFFPFFVRLQNLYIIAIDMNNMDNDKTINIRRFNGMNRIILSKSSKQCLSIFIYCKNILIVHYIDWWNIIIFFNEFYCWILKCKAYSISLNCLQIVFFLSSFIYSPSIYNSNDILWRIDVFISHHCIYRWL